MFRPFKKKERKNIPLLFYNNNTYLFVCSNGIYMHDLKNYKIFFLNKIYDKIYNHKCVIFFTCIFIIFNITFSQIFINLSNLS